MDLILHDANTSRWLEFTSPLEIISTHNLADVQSCLESLESKIQENKLYGAGFITYDAAPAFDEAMVVHTENELPLIQFGLYKSPKILNLPTPLSNECSKLNWNASVKFRQYEKSISDIKHYIAAGDTYQVNYTLRLNSAFFGNPKNLFFELVRGQEAEYAGFVDMDTHAFCSISPELFFTFDQGTLISKPMKGTISRGMTLSEDNRLMEILSGSEKDRAENVMIVDMIRNDMGRIAEIGTVEVQSLYDIKKYPYVMQMTSTVISQTQKPLSQVFKALFPCASITGAPKVRTMEIIKDLEDSPRGIYTGSIGFITPEKRAQFSVPIRTISIDKSRHTAQYGVGGGIVWDSKASDEYNECLVKSEVLYRKQIPFELFESLLWEKTTGFYLLKEHLERLTESATYFDFPLNRIQALQTLETSVENYLDNAAKIRLVLQKNGEISAQASSLSDVKSENLNITLANSSIDSKNRFLFHKTSCRQVYETAQKENPEADDVILWNEKREITESCRANIVVDLNGRKFTPLIQCGLLAGTYRRFLLEAGEIEERIISIEDFKKADNIYLINSVRKWMSTQMIL